MPKPTHTPGPWRYAHDGGTTAYIVESDGTSVAKLSVTENSTAHSGLEANARLMAAAPDLLEALQYCRQKIAYMTTHGEWHSPGRAIEIADAAITRATGGAA